MFVAMIAVGVVLAKPSEALVAQATGRYTLRISEEQVSAYVESSVELFLKPHNVAIRTIANARLSVIAAPCLQYDFEIDEQHFSVVCDGRTIEVPLDGSSTQIVADPGRPLRASLISMDEEISVRLTGDHGEQVVWYRFGVDGLVVTKQISSQRLGGTFDVEYAYERRH